MAIPRFQLEQSRDLLLTSNAGLALVGQILKKYTNVDKDLTQAVPRRRGVSHADVARVYTGLLWLGRMTLLASVASLV